MVNVMSGMTEWVCMLLLYACSWLYKAVYLHHHLQAVPPSLPALCSWGWCIPRQVSWWCVLRVRAYLLGPRTDDCLDQLVASLAFSTSQSFLV